MSKNDKGICMKSIYIILATLTVETLIIWFASYLLGWNFTPLLTDSKTPPSSL